MTPRHSSSEDISNVLNKHVLPYWREWRLRDIGKLDVQQFVADKFRQQAGWQTVRNAWTLLSGILETAVESGLPHHESCARGEVPAAGRT